MIIKSFTPHSITIFADTTFDPSIRKYRGGTPICTIPKADRMLSAHQKPQIPAAPLETESGFIPLRSAPEWASVDPIPDATECDYAIVSALYVSACKDLGMDTSRLLTIGGSVVDDAGKIIGTVWLNRN